MSDKSLDEIATAIWRRGYDAGKKDAGRSSFDVGYQQALADIERWAGPETQDAEPLADRLRHLADWLAPVEPIPNSSSVELERAPGRARVLAWLSAQPDGATHSEMLRSGIGRDNAALWRLCKAGLARQDPDTLRYYAITP